MFRLPEAYMPVIRRLREKRESLIYNPSSNLIYLLEEQAPEDFIFLLYHEISHSCHMQSNMGLFLETLHGIKASLSKSIVLSMPKPINYLLNNTFFSSSARTKKDINAIASECLSFFDSKEGKSYVAQCSKLMKSDYFNMLINAYNEIEARENILINEWRFVQEGFAYYTEMLALANEKRTYTDAKVWASHLGMSMTMDSFKTKMNEMIASHSPIIEKANSKSPTPAKLINEPSDAFDVYEDGVSFLLKYFGNGKEQLEVNEVIQVASHIPIFHLPGLDSPLEDFREAVRRTCSPQVRLARLTTCRREENFTFESFQRYLTHAGEDSPLSPNSYEDFNHWEYNNYWNSKLLCELRGNEKIALPNQRFHSKAHIKPYQTTNMRTVALIGEYAISCQIKQDIGALPKELSDFEKKMLEVQLERQYFLQAYEGLKLIFKALSHHM